MRNQSWLEIGFCFGELRRERRERYDGEKGDVIFRYLNSFEIEIERMVSLFHLPFFIFLS